MPKLKLGLGNVDKAALDKAAEENTFKKYDGEVPPADAVYNAVIKVVHLVMTKADESKGEVAKPMFRGVVEIREPKDSPKAQYNGYAIMHHVNLPIDPTYEYYGLQAANTKEFLCALASGSEAAWDGFRSENCVVSEDKIPRVTKFGTYNHNHKVGTPVKILLADDGEYKGKPSRKIQQFNTPKKKPEDDVSSESDYVDDGVDDYTEPEVETTNEDNVPAAVEESEAEPESVADDSDDSDQSGDDAVSGSEETEAPSESEAPASDEAEPAPGRRRRRRFVAPDAE